MVSQGTFPIRLLDLVLRCTALNAKDLVIVFSFAQLLQSFGLFESGLVIVASIELDYFFTVSDCLVMLVIVLVTNSAFACVCVCVCVCEKGREYE